MKVRGRNIRSRRKSWCTGQKAQTRHAVATERLGCLEHSGPLWEGRWGRRRRKLSHICRIWRNLNSEKVITQNPVASNW